MERSRLPVDVLAGGLLGALLGALVVVFGGTEADTASIAMAGGLTLGSLGAVRWIRQLSSVRHHRTGVSR